MEGDVSIEQTASVVGPFEGEGPLGKYFDVVNEDDLMDEKSYESAESGMLKNSIELLMKKASVNEEETDVIIGGDLLNQITATTFAVRDFAIPYWGIYNACATYTLGLQIASLGIDSGAFKKAIVTASSHFSTSERQYRSPLELGTQNPATSQRTVTGAGSCLVASGGGGPYINDFTIGSVTDLGQCDPYNMGSAMAPAAVKTLIEHFANTKTDLKDYDLVLTGDLANEGLNIAKELLEEYGYPGENITDCGKLIYDDSVQYVNNGGSGAGCCANVFNGFIYKLMKEKRINTLLFVATGALLSTTSSQQSNSIPCIAHAVTITNERRKYNV